MRQLLTGLQMGHLRGLASTFCVNTQMRTKLKSEILSTGTVLSSSTPYGRFVTRTRALERLSKLLIGAIKTRGAPSPSGIESYHRLKDEHKFRYTTTNELCQTKRDPNSVSARKTINATFTIIKISFTEISHFSLLLSNLI